MVAQIDGAVMLLLIADLGAVCVLVAKEAYPIASRDLRWRAIFLGRGCRDARVTTLVVPC